MFTFQPILKSVLWGGERIAAFKGVDTDRRQIGESWEVSGVEGRESVVDGGPDGGHTLPELVAKYGAALVGHGPYERHGREFPLLVKIIDARHDLSLQVHPGDDLAGRRHGCSGKTEMWYVIDAAPGAQILAGFERAVDAEQMSQMAHDGSIMAAVRHYSAAAGDAFFLPPGTIHSIGAGNLIAEVQQASDITYRVYDHDRRDAMGNRRELHTDLAREALHYDTADVYRLRPGSTPLLECDKFVVDVRGVDGLLELPLDGIDSFVVLLCLDGSLAVDLDNGLPGLPGRAALPRGASLLLPACATTAWLTGTGRVLATWLPNS